MSETTAVGYARRSTELQERSVPDQQAYVEKWAKEHGYAIKRWYVDEAISGTSTKGRDQFEQMISDAEHNRDFDAILCYDVSRFSRGGTNETGYYLHRLKLVAVEAVFPAEGIPEGDEGELLQGVKSWQARQYSVKLSRDTIRGQISNITERHCAPGGAPPYGYDKQHIAANGQVLRTFRYLSDGRKEEYDSAGRLVRVLPRGEMVKKAKSDIVRYVVSTADRMAVVKRVFELAIEGYGGRHIAGRLNDDGIPSPDGRYWNGNQARKMLASPAYRGALVWNKRHQGKINGVDRQGKLKPRRGTYSQKLNPMEDWYIVENVHEPLVSKEDYDRAHAALDSRRLKGGLARTTNRSLLSGLIVCKRCGWRFGQAHTKWVSKRGVTRFRYYIDRGYHTGGKSVCKSTHIPADALDQFIFGLVHKALLGDHQTVKQAVESFVKKVLATQKLPADTSGMAKELDGLTRRIKDTVSMLTDPAFEDLDELKTALATLKGKRDRLQEALETAKPSRTTIDPPVLRTWAMERLEAMEKAITGKATTMEARKLVHSVVEKIEIDPRHGRGTVYLPQDVYGVFMRETSTRGTLRDQKGRIRCGSKSLTNFATDPWIRCIIVLRRCHSVQYPIT
jgi:DNA invertase Pin-like site-specific DNA recombinase